MGTGSFAHNHTSHLNDMVNTHAVKVLQLWNGLADELIFRFSDNVDIMNTYPSWRQDVGSDEIIRFLSYPSDWLNAVGFHRFATKLPPSPAQTSTVETVAAPLTPLSETTEWAGSITSYLLVATVAFGIGRISRQQARPVAAYEV